MIKKLKELFAKYKQFICFCVVGALNTLVSYLTFLLLNWLVGSDNANVIWLLNSVSDVAGGINSYLWNRFWVFKHSNTNTRESLPKFFITFCTYLLISALLFKGGQLILPISENIIKIIILPITTIINYFMNKLWAFKKSSRNG